MIMHPPGKIAPIPALLILIREPRDHNRRPGDARLSNASIPDVTFQWVIVARAIQPVFVPELVQRWRAIARADGNAPKCLLKRVQQSLAKGTACLDCKIGVFGDVLVLVEIPDLGIQKIPHEEMPGQAHAAKRFKAPHAARFAHPQ